MTIEDEKAARLAAALRANLAKRKAQKRAREEPPPAGDGSRPDASLDADGAGQRAQNGAPEGLPPAGGGRRGAGEE